MRIVVVWTVLLCGCAWALAATPPRLGLTPSRVEDLRAAAKNPGDPRHAIFQLLQGRLQQPGQWWSRDETNWNYGRAYLATAAAFAHQVTGEAAYARLAFDTMRAVYEDPDPDRRLPHEGYGLSRATVGLGLAYTWDWVGAALAADEQEWLRARMREALDAWPAYQHANLETDHQGSNWVSVCRGGELVLMLAAREETARAERYGFLKRSLEQHMRNFDEIGVSQEGIGYTAYGGIFLLRALLALRDVGDLDLDEEAARHGWWRQAMYAGSFSMVSASAARAWLMSGVGGPAIGDEGWASLLLGFVPRDQLPYFLWWYNRHLGAQAVGEATWRFDPRRDGQVWAMLLYPADVQEADPTGVFPSGITGSAGQVLLRNRWRNQGDVQVSVHADLRHHSHAWDQPEAFSVHVLAHGETWLGGPGKETAPQHFSTLLVDGRHAREKGGVRDGGVMKQVLLFPQGALIGMEGGEQYRQLGVRQVERQVLVHFHPNSDDLLLSTLDRIESDEPHTYTWQANLGEPGQTRIVVRDRRFRPSLNQPFVTMGGGWPVCSVVGELPGAAEAEGYRIRYGDPVRIERAGTSVELWVQLSWRCVGGRKDARGAIVEAPHLTGTVGRDAQGNLALQLGTAQGKPAQPIQPPR